MKEPAVMRACGLLGGPSALAARLGVTPTTVSEWRTGRRPVPIERCVEIEQLTAGGVTRAELRPLDWRRIWPELADKAAQEG